MGKFLQMYEKPIFPIRVFDAGCARPGPAACHSCDWGAIHGKANGITGAFGWDVVQASTRVNYASNLKYIHGLEAMVCMAAEGGMSVQGGNWRIFEHMIAASNATALQHRSQSD